MSDSVSKGAIDKLINAIADVPNSKEMFLQVNTITQIEIGGKRRFGFTLTDGTHTIYAMGGTLTGTQVTNGQVKENSVIRIEEWMINNVNGQRYVFE